MTETTWGDLYGSGTRSSVPSGTYQIQVTGTRQHQGKTLFLDLTVLSGPEAGKMAQVNLYVPAPGEKGSSFYFNKKVAGLLAGPPPGFAEQFSAGNREGALDVLGTALNGAIAIAEISVRADGDYAGTNELESTKPLGAPAAPPVATAPQAAGTVPQPAAPAAAPAAPVAPAVVPVQPAAAPAPAPVPQPAYAGADEVPF